MRHSVKERFIIFAAFTLTFVSTLGANTRAIAADCPENWNLPATQGKVNLITGTFPEDLIPRVPESSVREISSNLSFGQKYLYISDFQFRIPNNYLTKINQNPSDVVVQSAWKTSSDGKKWLGLVATQPGNLLPMNDLYLSQFTGANPDLNSLAKSVGLDRAFPITTASRFGITPGKILAVELKIIMKGCNPYTIFERKSIIPNYSISTVSAEQVIDSYYSANPQAKKINFLSKASCLESLTNLVSHVKEVSAKSSSWTISNTSRGVLDMAWSKNRPENTSCWEGAASSNFPFFDLALQPTLGDGCLERVDPYKSTFTYKTNFVPCGVSVDSYGYEVAKFTITKLNSTETNKQRVITCIKGKTSKKVTGINPICPSGYKKK